MNKYFIGILLSFAIFDIYCQEESLLKGKYIYNEYNVSTTLEIINDNRISFYGNSYFFPMHNQVGDEFIKMVFIPYQKKME
jgi:hypothetical protein